ncbi:MAG: cytochrome b [Hyphomicrobium sp.]|uniref:cytochrome b n=1 Tax=Hyphomicrobium sp. TaxID=82 RepID=UPI001323A882|nr:cytochrome b [Hyphomicrobium sp.]KAB2940961.1 MAG: cytochrome b [Hyphomicrobium sp.]MBZ0210784.1 cytochrome b [Hyphomicrobium sp.]
MHIRDTTAGYGLPTRIVHWLMAVAIVGMYVLGLWMVELDYYSPYYRTAPDIHRSVGMLLLFLLVPRFIWRLANVMPSDDELSPIERRAAQIVHWGFYPLLLALMVSGYLMSTADGRPIEVFDWFSVPALVHDKAMEKAAGEVHEVLANITMIVVLLHAAASLKHHFLDRSRILARMWSGPANNQ